MKKQSIRLLLLSVLIVMSLVFTSCSAKSEAHMAPTEQSKADFKDVQNQATGTKPSSTAQANRKLIVKLSMEMRVDDIEKSILDAEAMAASAGGYTRESYYNENAGQLTIMIPAGNVDTFTKGMKSLGKVMNSNRTTEDVTDSYFDTQIRIKNLEAEIETMRNLLQKQGWKVSEILEIEREIRRLTDELESLKGFMTNLDRQVTFSEVRISFEKSQVAIDAANQDSLGYKLQLALKSGVNLLLNIITGLLSMIAFLLPVSPFVIVAYFILRKPIRNMLKKSQTEQQENHKKTT